MVSGTICTTSRVSDVPQVFVRTGSCARREDRQFRKKTTEPNGLNLLQLCFVMTLGGHVCGYPKHVPDCAETLLRLVKWFKLHFPITLHSFVEISPELRLNIGQILVATITV